MTPGSTLVPVPPATVPELGPGGRVRVDGDPGAPTGPPAGRTPAAPSVPERRLPTRGVGVPDPDGHPTPRPAGVVLVLAAILALSVAVGRLAGPPAHALLHNKMLPWIVGRSLGVATYMALTATVVLGLWLRHPWRAGFRRPGPQSVLWAHVTLAACTVVLLVGHLTSLALDQYAGVGWSGVFVPWGATYRPTGVALGTLAFYLLFLVAGTAALAGSIGRAAWFPIHTASVVVFCLTLVHGVLSGSDGAALRWLYVGSGGVVLGLQVTRWVAGTLGHGSAVVSG